MDAPVIRSNDNPSRELAQLCCCTVLLLGLIASAVSYIIFGIIFLIQDYGVANDCKGSNLWEYILVSLILVIPTAGVKSDNTLVLIIMCACIGIINLSMSVWGGIELWNYSCDDLKDSNLWGLGVASFILQLIISCICIIVPPLSLYFIWNNENPKEEPNPLNLKIETNV